MFDLPQSVITRLGIAELRELRFRLIAAVERIDREIERAIAMDPVRAWRQAAGLPASRQTIRWARRLRRNIEVMRLARQGFTNAEIAAHVGVHPSTVSAIVRHELRHAFDRIEDHALFVEGATHALRFTGDACENGRPYDGAGDGDDGDDGA